MAGVMIQPVDCGYSAPAAVIQALDRVDPCQTHWGVEANKRVMAAPTGVEPASLGLGIASYGRS